MDEHAKSLIGSVLLNHDEILPDIGDINRLLFLP